MRLKLALIIVVTISSTIIFYFLYPRRIFNNSRRYTIFNNTFFTDAATTLHQTAIFTENSGYLLDFLYNKLDEKIKPLVENNKKYSAMEQYPAYVINFNHDYSVKPLNEELYNNLAKNEADCNSNVFITTSEKNKIITNDVINSEATDGYENLILYPKDIEVNLTTETLLAAHNEEAIDLITTSASDTKENESRVYFGLDLTHSNVPLRHDLGGNLFNNKPKSASIFVGYKFDNVFIEFGGDIESSKKNHDQILANPCDFPQQTGIQTVLRVESVYFDTQYSLQRRYFGFGFTIQPKIFKDTKFSIFTGVELTKFSANYKILRTTSIQLTEQQSNETKTSFKKRELGPLLRLGMEWHLNKNFVIRSHLTCHMTNIMIVHAEESLNIKVKMRTHYSVGVGVAYSF